MRLFLIALCASLSIAATSYAAVNLQITEAWVGGLDGAEATSDWFELTNFGDMAATGLDGTLFYDDDSADPEKNDPLTGISMIAPGESVIYLVSWEDDFTTEASAVEAFEAMWGSPAGDLSGVQIGLVQGGSGLGGGGDIAFVFDGNTGSANIIDSAQYASPSSPPNANLASFIPNKFGDFPFPSIQSEVGVLGAYEGNLPAGDGVITDDGGNVIETVIVPNAVGSPGFATAPVPEPSTIAILALGLVGAAAMRRR